MLSNCFLFVRSLSFLATSCVSFEVLVCASNPCFALEVLISLQVLSFRLKSLCSLEALCLRLTSWIRFNSVLFVRPPLFAREILFSFQLSFFFWTSVPAIKQRNAKQVLSFRLKPCFPCNFFRFVWSPGSRLESLVAIQTFRLNFKPCFGANLSFPFRRKKVRFFRAWLWKKSNLFRQNLSPSPAGGSLRSLAATCLLDPLWPPVTHWLGCLEPERFSKQSSARDYPRTEARSCRRPDICSHVSTGLGIDCAETR